MLSPIKTEPAHIFLDGLHVFSGLLARIGVVKAEVTDRVVFLGDAEVQADGLGMAYVEEAVGFRGEPGYNFLMFAGF